MKLNIMDHNNKIIKHVETNNFEIASEELINQAIQFEQANLRQAIAHTKDRGDVSGGGIKPWRQKGTGRARAGSSRSPIWRGGGVTFGPLKDRNFSKRLPQKMHRIAIDSMLAKHLNNSTFTVIDEISFAEPKTKDALALLQILGLDGQILIILDQPSPTVNLAFRNLAYVSVVTVSTVSLLDLNRNNVILSTEAALKWLFGLSADTKTSNQSINVDSAKQKSTPNAKPKNTIKKVE